MNFTDNVERYDWRADAQMYGILSKFAFLAAKFAPDMDTEELDAYADAEEALLERGEINEDAFRVLIEAIEDWSGSKYQFDLLDEPIISADEYKKERVKELVRQIISIIEEQ